MAEISLTRPDIKYKESYIAFMREMEAEGYAPRWKIEELEAHFEDYLQMLANDETDTSAGLVPQSAFWLIVDGIVAGEIELRHYLNESLETFGGHIGYDICPSFRKKGYGTLQLKLALAHAWDLGIERVLITCRDDNVGSIKIIEANGGVLQDKVDNGRSSLRRRYWIEKP